MNHPGDPAGGSEDDRSGARRKHHDHYVDRGSQGGPWLCDLLVDEGGRNPPVAHPRRRARPRPHKGNTIAPDIVPTVGMGRFLRAGQEEGRGLSDSMADAIDDMQIPLARKGVIEDVGNSALFLASDMSSYITGTTLHPDGGALASSGWLNWPEVGWTARPPLSSLADMPRSDPAEPTS